MSRSRLTIAATLTVLVLGACVQQAGPATTTTPDTDVDEETGGDIAAFCDSYIAMGQASATEEGLRSPPEDVERLFDEVQANAPQEVSEPVGIVVDATRQAFAEGTPETFMSFEFNDAANEVNSYLFDNCVDEKLEVTAVEYAFEGVPDTVSAGRVGLRFTNDGDEYHEFFLFRKNDGVTESFDEILALPEEQREELMTFVGAANREPGEPPVSSVFEAEAGEYIALCPPHLVEGHWVEFTVEAP